VWGAQAAITGAPPTVLSTWIQGALIYFADSYNPTITARNIPFNVGPDGVFSVDAADSGVGLTEVHLSATDFPGWDAAPWISPTWNAGCNGAAEWRCPTTVHWSNAIGNLPPGTYTIRITATDAVGNTTVEDNIVNYYPTSWQYGGADHIVNTQSEVDAVRAGIDARVDGYLEFPYGLRPGDRDLVFASPWADSDTDYDADLSDLAQDDEVIATASGAIPTCRSHTFRGEAGYQAVQTDPATKRIAGASIYTTSLTKAVPCTCMCSEMGQKDRSEDPTQANIRPACLHPPLEGARRRHNHYHRDAHCGARRGVQWDT
jgi:hypothetical protein